MARSGPSKVAAPTSTATRCNRSSSYTCGGRPPSVPPAPPLCTFSTLTPSVSGITPRTATEGAPWGSWRSRGSRENREALSYQPDEESLREVSGTSTGTAPRKRPRPTPLRHRSTHLRRQDSARCIRRAPRGCAFYLLARRWLAAPGDKNSTWSGALRPCHPLRLAVSQHHPAPDTSLSIRPLQSRTKNSAPLTGHVSRLPLHGLPAREVRLTSTMSNGAFSVPKA